MLLQRQTWHLFVNWHGYLTPACAASFDTQSSSNSELLSHSSRVWHLDSRLYSNVYVCGVLDWQRYSKQMTVICWHHQLLQCIFPVSLLCFFTEPIIPVYRHHGDVVRLTSDCWCDVICACVERTSRAVELGGCCQLEVCSEVIALFWERHSSRHSRHLKLSGYKHACSLMTSQMTCLTFRRFKYHRRTVTATRTHAYCGGFCFKWNVNCILEKLLCFALFLTRKSSSLTFKRFLSST